MVHDFWTEQPIKGALISSADAAPEIAALANVFQVLADII